MFTYHAVQDGNPDSVNVTVQKGDATYPDTCDTEYDTFMYCPSVGENTMDPSVNEYIVDPMETDQDVPAGRPSPLKMAEYVLPVMSALFETEMRASMSP